jgi:hypothetical protein
MRRRLGLLAVLSVTALLGFAVQAQAASFTVGSAADTNVCPSPPAGNNCTLRQLINSVPAGSTIVVPDTLGTYMLSAGELLIEQNLTIVGAGARTTTIEQTGAARVFDIQRNPNTGIAPTVSISGVEMFFGKTTSTSINGNAGGNILNEGNLTLSEDWIHNGQTTGGSGGGIANVGGTLTLTHSLVDANLSFASSGLGGTAAGIDNTGAGSAAGRLTVDNSTLVNNSADGGAGAIWSRCTRCTSTATITNSTITANDGGTATANAGGIVAASTTTVSVQNSIVASNTVGTGSVFSNCSGATQITSLGHNLETGSDCGFAATGDIQNTDPLFLTGGVADTGGNTDTVALSANSPAVDAVPAGAPGCSGTDQRDVARPQGSGCDIGAYELTQHIEGSQFTQVLGSIDRGAAATIDWGDGGPTSNATADPATGEVTGTHTYTEAGIYHGKINFLNSDHLPAQTKFDIKVVDAPLTSAASPVNAIAGVSFTGPVATLTDANPFGTAADFAATITWGDGTATPGVVSAGPSGGFVVTGPHTYAHAGTYPTTIAITDEDGSSTTAHGTATVGARPSPVVTGPPNVKGSTTAAFAGSVNPDGAPTTARFEYGLDRRYITAGASGPQYDHSTPSQSVGSDFSSHTVSASVSGLVPNALYHVRLVATNAAGTTDGPDMTFTTKHGSVPGAPGLGKTFNVSATGLVLIQVNGVFIPVTELTKIKNGTIINALHGTLNVTTALPAVQHATIAATNRKAKKPKTKTQKGKFGGAVFKVTQARSGLTTLALVEGAKFKGAPTYASCKTKKGKAVTAALSSKTLQLLKGRDNHGKFRTKGRYAAATTRGTAWSVADRCDGTLTKVTQSSVLVNDFVRHISLIVRAGHSYLALTKPPHKRK